MRGEGQDSDQSVLDCSGPWILAAIKEVPNDFEVPCCAGCVHTDGTVSDGKHSHKNGGSFVAPSA